MGLATAVVDILRASRQRDDRLDRGGTPFVGTKVLTAKAAVQRRKKAGYCCLVAARGNLSGPSCRALVHAWFTHRALYIAAMNTTRFSLLRPFALAGLLLVALGGSGVLLADDDDHERARQALASGQVLPLSEVLAKMQQEGYPGQVLKVEFEREHGRYIYEIRLLQSDGRVAKLVVDAVDGRVLKVKRKDKDKGGD